MWAIDIIVIDDAWAFGIGSNFRASVANVINADLGRDFNDTFVDVGGAGGTRFATGINNT
jgi:hypothetical protein